MSKPTAVFTVVIEASDAEGRVWQALTPSEVFDTRGYPTLCTADDVAQMVAQNQDVAIHDGYRICVWEGREAEGDPAFIWEPSAVADLLNEYDGDDIWQDVIFRLEDYDPAAGGQINVGDGDWFVAGGRVIRRGLGGQWYDAGEYEDPSVTPTRVDQVGPRAVVLGLVDHEGNVHTFTPDAGFTRTLVTRSVGNDGWWRLTFADGDQIEAPGDQLLAVTGHADPEHEHEHYTAWLTTDASCLEGTYADVVVLADKVTVDEDGHGNEVYVYESSGDPLVQMVTTVNVDPSDPDPYDAQALCDEADNRLSAAGWLTSGEWTAVSTGYTITVDPASARDDA